MNDDAVGVLIEEFVGLKPQMYSYLVGDNREHKKNQRSKTKVIINIQMFY